MKRLGNELLIIQGKKAMPGQAPHPVEGWSAAPSVNEAGEENMLLWNIMIDGPHGSPYEGGTFRCTLTFPPEFPNHPPQLVFVTHIYHPNFPKVCPVAHPLTHDFLFATLDSAPQDLIGLGTKWKGTKYVPEYIGNVIQLLREPSPDDAIDKNDAFHQFTTDRAAFNDTARRVTLEHAK